MKRIALIALAGLALSAARGADPTPTPTPTRRPTPTPTEEKEGKIAGIAQKRTHGGWIGIEIKDQCFVMTFYNDKKKPVAADVTEAVMWWPVNYQPNNERIDLQRGDVPSVLSSPKVIKPPYTFRLHVTLLSGASAGPVTQDSYGAAQPELETYIVDFSSG